MIVMLVGHTCVFHDWQGEFDCESSYVFAMLKFDEGI